MSAAMTQRQISRALNERPRVLGLEPFVFWTLLALVALAAVGGSFRGMVGVIGLGAVLRVVQPIVEGQDPRRIEILVRGLGRRRGSSFYRPARSAFAPPGPRRVR